MNWDAIAAIAEILGAIVVVASLIYVGRQLAQNTEMMRIGTASESMERDFDLVLPLIENPELAEIWLKGDHRLDELGAADRQRLILFERRAILLWHHNYQLRMQGLVTDALWDTQNWIMQNIGRRQSLREAWSLFEEGYEDAFRDYMNQQLQIGDGLADDG